MLVGFHISDKMTVRSLLFLYFDVLACISLSCADSNRVATFDSQPARVSVFDETKAEEVASCGVVHESSFAAPMWSSGLPRTLSSRFGRPRQERKYLLERVNASSEHQMCPSRLSTPAPGAEEVLSDVHGSGGRSSCKHRAYGRAAQDRHSLSWSCGAFFTESDSRGCINKNERVSLKRRSTKAPLWRFTYTEYHKAARLTMTQTNSATTISSARPL